MSTQHHGPPTRRGGPGHLVALVLGCLLLLPAVVLVLTGGGTALGQVLAQDDDGYLSTRVEGLRTPTVALVGQDVPVSIDRGTPQRLVDALGADVRLTVRPRRGPVFVGIAAAADVDQYLERVSHEQVVDVDSSGTAQLRRVPGAASAPPPGEEDFWVASSTGAGTPVLTWRVTPGQYAVVVMNIDGSAGVDAGRVSLAARSGLVLPVALSLLVVGVVLTAGGAALVAFGASGRHGTLQPGRPAYSSAHPDAVRLHAPQAQQLDGPVVLCARLDQPLSRLLWLVKWLLAVPHLLVLALLWPAFVTVTLVAGLAVLLTGRYPRSLFAFNEGVLRWSWRVSYYAFTGGLGTDRYPPFTLGPAPDYPATLEIVYPTHLSRGLVTVKWWLLALPHYLVLGLLVQGWGTATATGTSFAVGGGLLGLLSVLAGVVLLATGSYPRPLFDVVVGLNRWVFRVIGYAALMTDAYPPFRLDAGGSLRTEAADTATRVTTPVPAP